MPCSKVCCDINGCGRPFEAGECYGYASTIGSTVLACFHDPSLIINILLSKQKQKEGLPLPRPLAATTNIDRDDGKHMEESPGWISTIGELEGVSRDMDLMGFFLACFRRLPCHLLSIARLLRGKLL